MLIKFLEHKYKIIKNKADILEAGLLGFSHVEELEASDNRILSSIKAHLTHQHSPTLRIEIDGAQLDKIESEGFPVSVLPILTELMEFPEVELILLISMEFHKYELMWPSIYVFKILQNLPRNHTDAHLILQYINESHLKLHFDEYTFLSTKQIEDFNQLKYHEISILLEQNCNAKYFNKIMENCLQDISMSRFRTVIEHSSIRLRNKLGQDEELLLNRKYLKGLWLEQTITNNPEKYDKYKDFIISNLDQKVRNSKISLGDSGFKAVENIVGSSSGIKNKRKLYNLLRLLNPRDLMPLINVNENTILNFLKNSNHYQFWYNCLLESACLHRDQELIDILLICLIHHPRVEIMNHLYGMLRSQIKYSFYQKFILLSLQNCGFETTLMKCSKLLEIRYFSWSKKTSDRILGYIKEDPFFLQNDMMEIQNDNLRKLVLHMHTSSLQELGEILEKEYSFSEEKLSYWKSMLYLRIKLRNGLRKWQKINSNT